MGRICHHTLVVTSLDERIEPLHSKAVEIFGDTVSAIVNSGTNGYRSFFVAPDGSKEGWDLSVNGDRRRQEFIAWLTQQIEDDPWAPLNWVEIQYGDDTDEPTHIVGDSSLIARKVQEST